jgi:electron transfer flavoprotein alpha/beta subunit
MNVARIRKALAAALAAGVTAALASLQAAGHVDSDTVTQAVGAGVAAALLAGIATYAAKNAPPLPPA